MAEELLDQLRNLLDGQIDFEGQKLVESISTLLFIFVGIISFTVGIVLQDIIRTLYIGLGGSVLVFLIAVPPWPFYKHHPITWLPVRAFDNQVNSSSSNNFHALYLYDVSLNHLSIQNTLNHTEGSSYPGKNALYPVDTFQA